MRPPFTPKSKVVLSLLLARIKANFIHDKYFNYLTSVMFEKKINL